MNKKSENQNQCGGLKSKKNKKGSGCLSYKKAGRSKDSDGPVENNKIYMNCNENARSSLVPNCADGCQRDWEKEGGRPKTKPHFKESMPQERLVTHNQVKNTSSKKKIQKTLKKCSPLSESQSKVKTQIMKNSSKTNAQTDSHVTKDETKKKPARSVRGKELTTKKNGKRQHQSTSDSHSPSASPRNVNCKHKKSSQQKRKTHFSRSKTSKKHTNNKAVTKPEVVEDNWSSTVDEHPQALPSTGVPVDNDWDDLGSLSGPFSDVARPLIEFHQHFLSTVLAGIFSPSSSDYEEDESDNGLRIHISSEFANYDSSSSDDSEDENETFFSGRNRLQLEGSDNESSQTDCLNFDSLATSGSEHSAEDSDISEDDFIYRVADDYDDIDPLMSSSFLLDFIMYQELFAEDTANTLYGNIVMALASRPEFQSDGAPEPATKETISSLPSVVATKEILEDNASCAICRSDYDLKEKLTQLPCKHMFHPVCVTAWLHKSGTCPVCRFVLAAPTDVQP